MSLKTIAIAVFHHSKIKGTVEFTELNSKQVRVFVQLSGFGRHKTHAIHIHEAGDLSDPCTSTCAHFNPFHKNHGGIRSKERHVGDLGNITSDEHGNVHMEIIDHLIQLSGTERNIIGRAVVIHERPDDNGEGGFPDSLTTGHAGKRIACAVIGYSKKMFAK